jgi:hypothetical protein
MWPLSSLRGRRSGPQRPWAQEGRRSPARRRQAALKPAVEQLEARCLLSGNVVFEWTDLLLNAGAARGQGTQVISRSMAIMEAAIYDSVNALDHAYTVYHVDAHAPAGTSPEAAAAQAAHDVAVSLYSLPAEINAFNVALGEDLAAIPDGQAKSDGIALGQYVASQVLAWRSTDHSGDKVAPPSGTGPGVWQPTPPGFGPPVTPQWPSVTPFAMTSGSQFRPGPPPALTSAEYTEAFQEIKALGGNGTTTPSERTPEQTEIAKYWAQAAGTSTPVGYWNHVAETVAAATGNSLAQDARLFGLLNTTMADSAIAVFDAKYAYFFWRPVTAIRAADTDGNPDTSADPTWTPLIVTPSHPSYPAFHAILSEAAAQALASFFGTDHVSFTATSESLPGVERSYKKFSEAAREAGLSRIYAGIHWRFDVQTGLGMGRELGGYVADNFFLPATIPVNGTDAEPHGAAGPDGTKGRVAPAADAGGLARGTFPSTVAGGPDLPSPFVPTGAGALPAANGAPRFTADTGVTHTGADGMAAFMKVTIGGGTRGYHRAFRGVVATVPLEFTTGQVTDARPGDLGPGPAPGGDGLA